MDVNEVIIRPVLSEKSTEMTELGKYVFRVSTKANKRMIKRAVKEVFDVDTEKVNIIRVRGKKKRVRYKYGYTSSWKKAIITLKKGQTIELFEGQ